MADDFDEDDVGWWDCSLCTYKNSAEKFKCDICDLRRGTSTRKPRCNADIIVAQVVKQQEQIRQQTRAKPTGVKGARSSTSSINDQQGPTTSSDTHTKSKKPISKVSQPRGQPNSREDVKGIGNEQDDGENDQSDSYYDSCEEKRKKKIPINKKRQRPAAPRKSMKTPLELYDSSSDSDSSNNIDKVAESPETQIIRVRSSSASSVTSDSSSAQSPEEQATPQDHHSLGSTHKNRSERDILDENSNKLPIPIEINGNLIKYVPPTSTGRTGLIIDKKKFTQHSVTVNDVTITFTEFATRQNNYIRKKKKRRDHSRARPHQFHVINGGSEGGGTSSSNDHKNRVTTTKSESKKISNSAIGGDPPTLTKATDVGT